MVFMRKNSNDIKLIKEKVLQQIQEKVSIKKVNSVGKYIYETENGLLFDIAYASLNQRGEHFFGIEKEQLDNIYQHNRNFYQVFICEHEQQVFFIPISLLQEIFKNGNPTQHNGFSQYKPIITVKSEKNILRCFGRWDIDGYLNKYDIFDDINFEQTKTYKAITSIARETELKTNNFHTLIINMLKKIGEWENFEVLTEQKPKEFKDFPYSPDLLWYKNGDLYLAIEVCYKGNIEKDKDCLKLLKRLGARKVILVADINKLQRIRKLFMYNGEIKSWTEFWSFDRILKMYDEGEKFFKSFQKFRSYSYNENLREYL